MAHKAKIPNNVRNYFFLISKKWNDLSNYLIEKYLHYVINPFHITGLTLYCLKTSGNLRYLWGHYLVRTQVLTLLNPWYLHVRKPKPTEKCIWWWIIKTNHKNWNADSQEHSIESWCLFPIEFMSDVANFSQCIIHVT